MAVPKRKVSKARRDKRRANWKLSVPGMVKCPQCGAENLGKFCSECGTKKPAGVYQCSNCGWKPADPAHPPKFCPECGNPFNEMDLK